MQLLKGLGNHAVGDAPLNDNLGKSDQEGSGEDVMKRFALFAIVGPLLAAATLFLILLLGAIPGFICSWLTMRINKPVGLTAQ
jgi:hypothetical protein